MAFYLKLYSLYIYLSQTFHFIYLFIYIFSAPLQSRYKIGTISFFYCLVLVADEIAKKKIIRYC